MPDIRANLKNPSHAAAGALLQRQTLSLDNLQAEANSVFKQAVKEGIMSGGLAEDNHLTQDSFRHAYASARVTQEYGSAVANVMGRGLEMMAALTRENDNASTNAAEIGMDLNNNAVGREIGNRLGKDATPLEIAAAINEAAADGRLILSGKDPAALANYQNQYDMQALGGVHDAAVAVGQAGTAVLDKGVAVAQEGKQMLAGLKDSVTDSLTQFASGGDSAGGGVSGAIQTMLTNYKESLFNALEKASDSPFFMFNEQQLKEGEEFIKQVPGQLVAATEEVVDYGSQMTLSSERFASAMESVERTTGVPALEGVELQNESEQVASLDQPTSGYSEAQNEAEDEAQASAEMEMEMDVA